MRNLIFLSLLVYPEISAILIVPLIHDMPHQGGYQRKMSAEASASRGLFPFEVTRRYNNRSILSIVVFVININFNLGRARA